MPNVFEITPKGEMYPNIPLVGNSNQKYIAFKGRDVLGNITPGKPPHLYLHQKEGPKSPNIESDNEGFLLHGAYYDPGSDTLKEPTNKRDNNVVLLLIRKALFLGKITSGNGKILIIRDVSYFNDTVHDYFMLATGTIELPFQFQNKKVIRYYCEQGNLS